MKASPGLSINTYHEHWATLLGYELDNIALKRDQIILWKIGVKVANWINAEFTLYIPGIRENYPRLEVGDLIQLREVLEKLQKGSGVAFEARVVALRKREGFIHFVCPTLKNHIERLVPPPSYSPDGHPLFTPEDALPTVFNVSFTVNARSSFIMETATFVMGEALKTDPGQLSLARQWLFPETVDLDSYVSVYSVDRSFQDEDWIDKGLNLEQQFTASSIALHQSPVPYLISGPPGTGKTRTVTETVLQILRLQPEACILLCAPSNSATDTLVLRLRRFLQPNEMLRLNDQNRTFAEVPIKITQYCYIENNKFALPPWKTLMKYRVVVCSCLDAGILVAAHCTNTSLMRLEEEVVSSLHFRRKDKSRICPHWTHLLVDEAAQGSEPELLIPVSVVCAQLNAPVDASYVPSVFIPQLVLCGDSQQLGPIVTSDAARAGELDISLLERLFDRPLYRNHPHARQKTGKIGLRPGIYKFKPFSNLVKNYRSHPAILMPPSAIFYDDSLEPHANNGVIAWSGLPDRHLPLVFIGHQNSEASVDERATWFNIGEIDRVVATIKSLLSEGESSAPPLRPSHIGVMAPWREQVWKLRSRLREEGLSTVDVGTVEDYQGRESRVIIISCVRSNERFLKEDLAKGSGIVHEKKRMNVAITRARELLIVIGNGSVLRHDTYWKAFLQFTLRNKLYVGPNLDIEMDGNYISRLESNYINTITGEFEEEELGVATAGGIAREILRGGGG
ncbi:P-loop containing nucleoside triphosphate hydrolase protein [Collybia nuda]|uniref:P-loop containing nucleoside triphosphate hydrolase protein n=1 Tax=Collybia nuda TaxID=64659 RepID=A0A9P5XZ62_9AGAR|nr:P-loop containing nucleoside triphosphate hydrolase protein [Collybia nuda]